MLGGLSFEWTALLVIGLCTLAGVLLEAFGNFDPAPQTPAGGHGADMPIAHDGGIPTRAYFTHLRQRAKEDALLAGDPARAALLQKQLDDIHADYAKSTDMLRGLRAQLDALTLPEHAAIAEAKEALIRLDFSYARALLLQETLAPSSQEHLAATEFALGQIAEEEANWFDAATHYDRAAKRAPNPERLSKAREFSWRSGAHSGGVPLIDAAIPEFGKDSAQHAAALNARALSLMSAGRYAEAEPMFRDAVEAARKALGEEHPGYATSLNNLAGFLQATGAYAEAEPLYRQALRIDHATRGEDHPEFATALNNLGSLLQAMGRAAEAEPLYRQAVDIGLRSLGEDHPDYAKRLNTLAALLANAGRLAEVEVLYQQACAITRRTHGEDHPKYAHDLNNLAAVWHDMGRYEEAEPLYHQAAVIFDKALGAEHAHTQTVRSNLARLREKLNR